MKITKIKTRTGVLGAPVTTELDAVVERMRSEESRAAAHRIAAAALQSRLAMEQGAEEIICFLHYPPIFAGAEVPQIMEILTRYPIRRLYYGHLHGESLRGAFHGERSGITFHVVSADAVGFRPVLIEK